MAGRAANGKCTSTGLENLHVLDDRLHRATVTITFPLLCPASTYR